MDKTTKKAAEAVKAALEALEAAIAVVEETKLHNAARKLRHLAADGFFNALEEEDDSFLESVFGSVD